MDGGSGETYRSEDRDVAAWWKRSRGLPVPKGKHLKSALDL